MKTTLRRSLLATTALLALAGPTTPTTAPAGAVAPSAAAPATGHGLRSVLHADAVGIVRQGAPGVLADLQAGGRDLRVRAGVGNRRTGTPVPWRAHFRIGSTTKTFVATVALQLVGEHRLSLDDTVDHWLPGLVRGHGNDGRRITVRELLQHTSGLPDYLQKLPWVQEEAGFRRHRFDTVTSRRAVRLAMTMPPVFAPGTSWSYSNTNYRLVGLIIEKVTGHSWRQEVRRRILRPLHLTETFLPGTRARVPGVHARGYERFPGPNATATDPDYGPFLDATRQNPSWGGSAGEMISTTHDLDTFLRALVGGRLLPPAQLAEMEHTVPTDAGFRQNWPGARYGLGLMWIRTGCGGAWAHGGDIMGYRTRNAVTADGRRAVTVSLDTDSTKPRRGVVPARRDVATALIDDALCGGGPR